MITLDMFLIIFVVLKATNLISWSWWAVLWPLWVAFIIGIIEGLIEIKNKNKNEEKYIQSLAMKNIVKEK